MALRISIPPHQQAATNASSSTSTGTAWLVSGMPLTPREMDEFDEESNNDDDEATLLSSSLDPVHDEWSSRGMRLTPREMDDFDDEFYIYHEQTQRKGVSDRIRRSLLTVLADADAQNEDCHVCQDKFTKTCAVTRLPCKHFYHQHCIGRWLDSNRSCPTCRYILKGE